MPDRESNTRTQPRTGAHAQKQGPRPRVVVVMPAYNAAKTLCATVRDLPADGIVEMILVDDASTGGTPELAGTDGGPA